MNAQVSNHGTPGRITSGQVGAVASAASMMHQGVRRLTTHEFEYQDDHHWLLTQRCYTHTGITYVPLKTYDVHSTSDKRTALEDAEQHIVSSGGRKGQWYSNTPWACDYDVPHHAGGRES